MTASKFCAKCGSPLIKKCSIHCDVSLDLVLKAPPGMFLVERFSKIEMLNIECSSSLKSPPENVLAETDSYTHSTFRNLLIEGHIRVDSSPLIKKPKLEILIQAY